MSVSRDVCRCTWDWPDDRIVSCVTSYVTRPDTELLAGEYLMLYCSLFVSGLGNVSFKGKCTFGNVNIREGNKDDRTIFLHYSKRYYIYYLVGLVVAKASAKQEVLVLIPGSDKLLLRFSIRISQ